MTSGKWEVPGGLDALRRLHNDIQDPLWDAMSGQEGSANQAQTYATQDTTQATAAIPAGLEGRGRTQTKYC